MKNLVHTIFYGKDSKVTVLLILSIFIIVGLACKGNKSSETKAIPPAYYGDWQGQDGTTLSIRANGTGDYNSGGKKVEGGTAEINEAEKTLSITFFGIGKTMKIDQPPTSDQMKLDGITFRRKAGFSNAETKEDTGSSINKTPFSAGSTSRDEAPSNSDVESLVKETVADFKNGVEEGEFTDFYTKASADFKASFTQSQINQSFKIYIDKKEIVLPVLNSVDEETASFSPPPRVRTEKGYQILVADGEFPTSPLATKFETEYEMEKGSWKLLKFKINMK